MNCTIDFFTLPFKNSAPKKTIYDNKPVDPVLIRSIINTHARKLGYYFYRFNNYFVGVEGLYGHGHPICEERIGFVIQQWKENN